MTFDGETYNSDFDFDRLKSSLKRVRAVLLLGEWVTQADIRRITGAGPEEAIGSRIRDLKKTQHGSYDVRSRRRSGGIWEYRIPKENHEIKTK